MMNIIFNYCYI